MRGLTAGLINDPAGRNAPPRLTEWLDACAVDPRSPAGLRQCMADLSLKRGFVSTTGDERRSVGKTIEILPWQALARGQVDIG